MAAFNKILPLVLLACIFVIGLPFVSTIMGSVDSGVNLTDTNYQEQYNSTTETSIQTLGMMEIIPLLVGVMVLVISIMVMKKMKGGL